jgi:ribosome-associated protein
LTPARKKGAAGRDADKAALDAAIGVARVADELKGRDITVLHVEKQILVTDYFVIVSARNKRQIQAVAKDALDHLRKKAGYVNARMEGYSEAGWVLIDAGPLIVHVFREDLRGYYDLELLWGDAPEVQWREEPE